jgi:uncharacterized protein (TIGR02145 family)
VVASETIALGVSILPFDAADKTVTWSSSNIAVATVNRSGVVKGENAGTAIITATAKDGSGVKATKKVEVDGVLINGTVWATRNVDDHRTFAATPESYGKLYQFNRSIAYSTSDPCTPTWNQYPIPSGLSAANDPCPNGWRIPKLTDADALLDGTINPPIKTAENGWLYTDKTNSSKTIYIPPAGWRQYPGGYLISSGDSGRFVCYTTVTSPDYTVFAIEGRKRISLPLNTHMDAHSVRCVRGAKP